MHVAAINDGLGRFQHVDWRLLALAVVWQLLGSVFHARAWANLLQAARPDVAVSRRAVLCAHLAGVAGNAVAPAHAGDGLKVLLVRRAMPGTAIATIVTTVLLLTGVDAVLGGSALLATACTSYGPPLPRPGGLGSLIAAAVLVAAACAAFAARRRLARVLGDARQGAALLTSPGRFAREAVSWQALAWLTKIVIAYLTLHAFGLPASLLDATLVVVVTGLAGSIPFLPGGVGVQQAMLVYVLRGTASATTVVGYGLGLQVGTTLVNLAIGLLALSITFRTLALRQALRSVRLGT
jgi:uncharacterized membrane protein YbhN (UPF0104 family)